MTRKHIHWASVLEHVEHQRGVYDRGKRSWYPTYISARTRDGAPHIIMFTGRTTFVPPSPPAFPSPPLPPRPSSPIMTGGFTGWHNFDQRHMVRGLSRPPSRNQGKIRMISYSVFTWCLRLVVWMVWVMAGDWSWLKLTDKLVCDDIHETEKFSCW